MITPILILKNVGFVVLETACRTTMWLPFTRRLWERLFSFSAPGGHFRNPGPGRIDERSVRRPLRCSPVPKSRMHRDRSRTVSSRRAETTSVRVRMVAPRGFCASTAFNTTRRASSTQQSEYSNPVVKLRLAMARRLRTACKANRTGLGQETSARPNDHTRISRAGSAIWA